MVTKAIQLRLEGGGEAAAAGKVTRLVEISAPKVASAGGSLINRVKSRVISHVDDLPCSCFVAGTKVATEHGKVAVEKIKPGVRVWAKNLRTGRSELRKVTALFHKQSTTLMTMTLASGAVVVVTQEHPFMVDGEGWVISGNLKAGDWLMQRDGGAARIARIAVLPAEVPVYNFTVAGDHNYYVTDAQLLVHNCPLQDKPGSLANSWGYSTKQVKTAIERVKQGSSWRGNGGNRNPDVFVDDIVGEVYPKLPNGRAAEDSIGNLFDHLPGLR